MMWFAATPLQLYKYVGLRSRCPNGAGLLRVPRWRAQVLVPAGSGTDMHVCTYMYPALGNMPGFPCLFLNTSANELTADSGRGHVLLRRVRPSTDAPTGDSHAETCCARGPIGLESRIKALVSWGAASCESWPTGGPASEQQSSILEMVVIITRHLLDAQFLGKLNRHEMTPWALAAVDCIGVKKCLRIQAVE